MSAQISQSMQIPLTARPATFWQRSEGSAVDCSLCYRRCHLEDGAAGWCGYRHNVGGRMRLKHYAELGVIHPFLWGYGIGSLCYYPGLPMLGIGTLHCTAGCSFCCVSSFSTHPERTEAPTFDEATPAAFYNLRYTVPPAHVVVAAMQWGCLELFFSYAEAMLSIEYIADTARLALEYGITSTIFTNGFSGPEPARAIAPYVRHVIIGVKGSLDDAFYARLMRSPDAVETVKATALAFRDAGVCVTLTDTIPSLHMQSDEAAEQHQAAYYAWIRAEFGPIAVLRVGELHAFNGNLTSRTPLLARDAKAAHYRARVVRAMEIARAAGLHYIGDDDAAAGHQITCHACGALLAAMPRAWVNASGQQVYRPHRQYAVDGHCPQCGVAVPLTLLPPTEVVRAMRHYIEQNVLTRMPEGWAYPSTVFDLRDADVAHLVEL